MGERVRREGEHLRKLIVTQIFELFQVEIDKLCFSQSAVGIG